MTDDLTPAERLVVETANRKIVLGEHGCWTIFDRSSLLKLPPPVWVVGNPMNPDRAYLTDGLTIVYGPSGVGKSALVHDLCVAVADPASKDWRGAKVRSGPVLYYATEAVRGVDNRIRAVEAKYGCGTLDNIYVVDAGKLAMDNPAHVAAMRADIQAIKPSVVVIDTLVNSMGDLEENAAADMTRYFQALNSTTDGMDDRPALIVVHHSGLDPTRMRGSTAVKGRIDTLIKVEEQSDDGVQAQLRISCDKQREERKFKSFNATRTPMHNSVVLVYGQNEWKQR